MHAAQLGHACTLYAGIFYCPYSLHISFSKLFFPRFFGLSFACPRLLQPIALPLCNFSKCPNATHALVPQGATGQVQIYNSRLLRIESVLLPLVLKSCISISLQHMTASNLGMRESKQAFKMPWHSLIAIWQLLSSLCFLLVVAVNFWPDSRVLWKVIMTVFVEGQSPTLPFLWLCSSHFPKITILYS